MNFLGRKWELKRLPLFSKNTDIVRTQILDKKRDDLFTKSHPLKLIISLSMAPILVIIVNAIYQLSDTFLTALLTEDAIMINGQLNSLSTIAINTSMVVWTPLWAVSMGLVQGSLAWFTKAQGAQDPKRMAQINSSAFVFIALTTFVSAIICIAAGRQILELGVSIPDPETKALVVDEAFRYIWPRLATLPFITIYLYLVRTMRTLNIRFWTTIPYIVSVSLNLVLDYVFIKFAKYGIFGSGLATALADFIAMTLALTIFIRYLRKEKDEVKKFTPTFHVMKEILVLGLPNIINLWLRSILLFFTVKWASQIGAIGVSSTMRVIDSLVIYPGFGFIQGAMIAMGYAYGSKNYARLHSLTKWLTYAIFSYFTFLTFILFFISDPLLDILQIFEPRGAFWMRLAYVALMLLSVGEAMRAYFSATHQKIKSLLCSMVTTLAPIPFLYLFGGYLQNLELYWYAYIAGDALAFMISVPQLLFLIRRSRYNRRHGKWPEVLHLSVTKIPKVKNANKT